VKQSNKEVGRYQFRRENNTQFTNLSLDGFLFDQSVEALGAGQASVRINFRNQLDTALIGSFFKLALPSSKYDVSSLQLAEAKSLEPEGIPGAEGDIKRGICKELTINGKYRFLQIEVNEETSIIVRKDPGDKNSPIEIFFVLMTGQIEKGASAFRSFFISATGIADLSPVTLILDNTVTGRPFKGFGGNFRLQNPVSDPPVIDYCLENMDVRWGRVEMPWRFWHPEETDDPISKALGGEIHPHVKASMEMAQRLHELGMPVILSDWSAPAWAIEGRMTWGPQPGGLRGNPLDQAKSEQIYKSIADYIQYVKDQYGFEFAMFSFNESDLGINVRQTA
jgi:hypothetical protein